MRKQRPGRNLSLDPGLWRLGVEVRAEGSSDLLNFVLSSEDSQQPSTNTQAWKETAVWPTPSGAPGCGPSTRGVLRSLAGPSSGSQRDASRAAQEGKAGTAQAGASG